MHKVINRDKSELMIGAVVANIELFDDLIAEARFHNDEENVNHWTIHRTVAEKILNELKKIQEG